MPKFYKKRRRWNNLLYRTTYSSMGAYTLFPNYIIFYSLQIQLYGSKPQDLYTTNYKGDLCLLSYNSAQFYRQKLESKRPRPFTSTML